MAIAETDGRGQWRLCRDWGGDMMCAEIYEEREGGNSHSAVIKQFRHCFLQQLYKEGH